MASPNNPNWKEGLQSVAAREGAWSVRVLVGVTSLFLAPKVRRGKSDGMALAYN